MKIKDFDFDAAVEEYLTVTDSDDDAMVTIKENMKALRPAEKRIMLTYIHYGTYAETGRQFNVSGGCIKSYIMNIKKKIVNGL